jgi:hypothetical protein
MAIQDRNLSVGTKLSAKYKGQTYTAEVAERKGKLVYRFPDGREFKSPSAAGTGITGLACNGWTFWSVSDGSENSGPVESTKARQAASSTVHSAPKVESKRRARKTKTPEPPVSGEAGQLDESPTHDPADDAPLEMVRCAECGEEFQGVQAATEHYYTAHSKREADEPTA